MYTIVWFISFVLFTREQECISEDHFLKHVQFKMSINHPSGDVKQIIGYTGLN